MKIQDIDTVIKDVLYAIIWEGSEANEFTRFLNDCRSLDFLEEFFESNWADIEFGYYSDRAKTVHEACKITIDDVVSLNDIIIDKAEESKVDRTSSLSELFDPLSNNDFSTAYRLTKVYQKGTWIRLYAIRLKNNVFVITGWTIKLTKNNGDRLHTQNEILKIKMADNFLRENCYEYPEDLERDN